MIQTIKNMKEFSFYLKLDQIFDSSYLNELFNIKLNNKTLYNLFLRVSYKKDLSHTEYKMLGEQISFMYKTEDDLKEKVEEFIDVILLRFQQTSELYKIEYDNILNIQIIVYKEEILEELKSKKNFSTKSLETKKDLLNVSKTTEILNKILPLTSDSKEFGEQLETIEENNKIKDIKINNNEVNLIDNINKHTPKKIESFSIDTNFYLKKVEDKEYILTSRKNNNFKEITVFTKFGMKIQDIKDEFIDKNNFIRKVGNVSVKINKNIGIVNKYIEYKYDPIKPKVLRGEQAKMIHPDWMVGTFDIETYKINEELSKIYSVGFYTENNLKTYYIEQNLDSDKLVMDCLIDMLKEKYNKYTFYVHNFKRFEIGFLLKVIIKMCNNDSNYSYKLFFKDNEILSLTLSYKSKKKKYTIKFVDSICLLPSSLEKLCKSFETDTSKSYFPYDFVNEKTLFYIGDKPKISYYNKINLDNYNNIKSKDWNLKEELLKYLEKDLISLYEVIDKFKFKIFLNYNTHITKSLTISSLALNIYLSKFYKYNIPLINKISVYNDIKKSYFGGITEVYKPHGKNLYYYDVNSLYPYCALNVMPGLNSIYLDNINKDLKDCEDLFGFFYCCIETPKNDYIGLLPFRDEKNNVLMPLGNFEGWYFSEELKFAVENGYKINVLKGYKFNKEFNVFNKYIEEFYNIKSTTKDIIMKNISKSLLNNLLGRFGLKIDNIITDLLPINSEEYSFIRQTKKIQSIYFIEDQVLITYINEISKNLCDKNDIDYNKALELDLKYNKKNTKEKSQFREVSIAISAAVTAYSRIHMNKLKLYIINNKGNIYYSDTDSIVTDIKLPDEMVSKTKLGKLKLEHEIDEAYFLSNKRYAIKKSHNDPKKRLLIKAAGSNIDMITWEDFENLYKGSNLKIEKYITKRNWKQGSVTIKVKEPLTLFADAYSKRTKLFEKNLWINTKPLILKKNFHTKILKNWKNRFREIIFLLFLFIIMIISFIFYYMPIGLDDSDICYEILDEDIDENQSIDIKSNEKIKENFIYKQLNYFMSLFHMKSSNIVSSNKYYNNSETLSNINSNKELLTKDFNTLSDKECNIITDIRKFTYNEALKENQELKNKISLLEIELLEGRIDKLDRQLAIKNIIKDIKKDLKDFRRNSV